MIISQINIYPIKGLGGIEVSSALAMERGFEHDRRFMLTDLEGNFLSQRKIPEMALFKPTLEGNKIQVQFNDDSIALNHEQEEGEKIDTIVWGNEVRGAIRVGKQADEWFSDHLGRACRLLKMNRATRRNKELLKSPDRTEVSFADGYPYLVLGTASLTELNSRLEKPVSMDRFRANIIVNSAVAHEEDELDECSINGIKFRMIKPCARCQVITIDQQDASRGKEPLKTLASYRQKDNKVYFGMNMVCLEQGVISVGDALREK